VEVLSAMVISAMILAAALVIYHRMQQSAMAVLARVNQSNLPSEVLQLIAEDLDKVTTAAGSQLVIENKLEKGFPVARLTLRKTLTNKKNEEQLLEEIVWQAAYDVASDRVTLYRSHSGLDEEDRLLDRKRTDADTEKLYPFVPVCSRLTTFKLQAPQGENLLDRWANNRILPTGILVTLSFADPVRTPQGLLEIPEESLITRMIAVDWARQIKFEVVAAEPNGPGQDANPPMQEDQKTTTETRDKTQTDSRKKVETAGRTPTDIRKETPKNALPSRDRSRP
jgi:hypothetical protein